MNLLLIVVIGVLSACGAYLMLRRSMLRVLLGMLLLSNAINLVLFVGGGLTTELPPIIAPGEHVLSPLAAEPLSQALILTAIVIGFGILAFSMALFIRACAHHKSDDLDSMTEELE